MFDVVIVDDEYWTLRGLENACDWKELKCNLAFTSIDPEEALAFIIESKPDVVITDIHMEALSGLDLIKEAKLHGVSSEFIICSGHSEFDYAKEAINYKVFEYLLKPIDRNQLKKTIQKIINKITSTSNNQQTIFDTLLNQNNLTDFKSLFDQFQKKITSNGFQTVIIENGDFPMDKYHNIAIKLSSNKKAYFINHDYDAFTELKLITDSCPISIGISSYYTQDVDPLISLKEANETLLTKFIYPEQKVFFYRKERKALPVILDFTARIKEAPEDAINIIDTLPTLIRSNNWGTKEIEYLYNQTIVNLNYFSNNHFLKYSDMEEIFMNFKTLSALLSYLKESIYTLMITYTTPNAEKVNNTTRFEDVLDYISNHYTEQIYLSDLSDIFHYNQTYISELFKKKLNKTFSDYILELRIGKAVDLLTHSSKSISEIADVCGYNDYCYFAKKFKKMTNYTPSQYKKKYSGECV